MVCLEPSVLNTVAGRKADAQGYALVMNNKSYRFFAYTQYIHMRYGILGKGKRRVIPSCMVLAIREAYPDPKGEYHGFEEGEEAANDIFLNLPGLSERDPEVAEGNASSGCREHNTQNDAFSCHQAAACGVVLELDWWWVCES